MYLISINSCVHPYIYIYKLKASALYVLKCPLQGSSLLPAAGPAPGPSSSPVSPVLPKAAFAESGSVSCHPKLLRGVRGDCLVIVPQGASQRTHPQRVQWDVRSEDGDATAASREAAGLVFPCPVNTAAVRVFFGWIGKGGGGEEEREAERGKKELNC